MRIDKYLKVSRLIKRRTVANEVADAGRITPIGAVLNGAPGRPTRSRVRSSSSSAVPSIEADCTGVR